MTYNDLLQTTNDIIKSPLGSRDVKKIQKAGLIERYSFITLDMESYDKDRSTIDISRLGKPWYMLSYASLLSRISLSDEFVETVIKKLTGEENQIYLAKELFLSVPPDYRTIITTPRCGTFAQSNPRILYHLSISPLSVTSDNSQNMFTKKQKESLIFIGSQLIDAKTGEYL